MYYIDPCLLEQEPLRWMDAVIHIVRVVCIRTGEAVLKRRCMREPSLTIKTMFFERLKHCKRKLKSRDSSCATVSWYFFYLAYCEALMNCDLLGAIC